MPEKEEDEDDGGFGGPVMRLKSLPLGLPARGDEDGALGNDDTATTSSAAGLTGDSTAGGADIRLRSLPFPFGGAMMLIMVSGEASSSSISI